MPVVEFQCPACAATLRTSNEKIMGKKIRCPKCSEPCPVPAAQVPEPVLSVSETVGGEAASFPSDNALPQEYSFDASNPADSEIDEESTYKNDFLSEPETEIESTPEPETTTDSTPEPEQTPEPELSSEDLEEPKPEIGDESEMTPTVYGSSAMDAHLGEAKPMSIGNFILSFVLFIVWVAVVGVTSYALLNLDLSRIGGETSSLPQSMETRTMS